MTTFPNPGYNKTNYQDSILPTEKPQTKATEKQEAYDSSENMKENVANRAFWKLLGECPPAPGIEEIVITGQVLGDGRGDWISIKNMHKQLQKQFPERQVRVIASSSKKWSKPGDLDVTNMKALDLVFYGNASLAEIQVPLDAFHPAEAGILEKAEKAGVIISAGLNISKVFESIHDKIREKSIKIKEHDTSKTTDVEFASTTIQTGIAPLEDRAGIFLNSNKEYHWQDLKNFRIKTFLLEGENPTQEQVDHYLSKHDCYLGYMKTRLNYYSFFQDAIAYTNANSPGKSVDFCIPGFCNADPPKFSKEYLNELSKQGIGKISITWFEGDKEKELTFILGSGKGNEMRVLDPGNLSAKDFKIMTSISGPIVGCTGDNSLAQALSYGKIPCYEARFPAKANALKNRIKVQFGKDSALYQYCKHAITQSEDYVGGYTSKLASQAKEFGKILREESNFKGILKGVVNEKLLRQKDKDFAKKEDKIKELFLQNKISMYELNSQFKALLDEKGFA